jgi:tetratricopeptide (TPR) repeat protein/tRNA A-37 threonylcarbamoyl transferase component Bud32
MSEAPRTHLTQLLLEDQSDRWRRGERVPVEDLLAGQPHLQADPEAVLDLITNEVLLRQQAGETPLLEEYQLRFPHLAEPLRLQFEVEQALHKGPVEAPTLPADLGAMNRVVDAQARIEPAGWPAVPGYEVLGELGRGGMGIVYKARQHSLNRVVALKMIRGAAHAGPDERARFRREAEAIARLQHPNIVSVYEVGEHEGEPFLSLEYCSGGSLADRLRSAPLEGKEAARLVEVLARAVQAAHDRQVVHRDLKPANVLLAGAAKPQAEEGGAACGFALPKVTDFGLAKKLDEPGQTASDALVGTPSYMAPEQAAGKGQQVGPAVDVYALGAILYECLTGRPPFKAATVYDTLLQVVSDEPVPVRRLQPGVPRDLETVCLKCLQKEARHRYASAVELAQDLGRFQAGEPVRARPVGPLERARKWAARRPAGAGLLAALLLLVVVSVGVAWRWQRQRSEGRARQREAAQKAVLVLEQGSALLDEGWREHDLGKLKEALATADRAADVAVGADEGVRAQAAAFQKEATDRLAQGKKNRALMVALLDVSAPKETTAYTPDESGQMVALAAPSVDEQYASAFQRWGLDVDRAPEGEVVSRLLRAPPVVIQEVLAGLDGWMLERRQQKRPEPEWLRLRRLADRVDEDQRSRQLRALLCGESEPDARGVAGLVGAQGGPAGPWAALGLRARDQRWRLTDLRAGGRGKREPVLSVLLLARASQEVGDVAGAEQVLRQALAGRPDQVVLHDALGRLLGAQGRLRVGEAIECYQAARALRPKLGIALVQALRAAGRAGEGEAVIRELLAEQPNHPELQFNLGLVLREQKRPAEAEKAFRRAIQLKPDLPEAHNGLGTTLDDQKRPADAEKAFRKVIELRPDNHRAYNNLGIALRRQKRPVEAEKALLRVIELTPDYALAYVNLGAALYDQKRLTESEKACRRAIALMPDSAEAHTGLGVCLRDQKRPAEAEKALRKAIEIKPDFALAHHNLGNVLRDLKRPAEAEKALRKALRLSPDDAGAYNNLGALLHAQKRPAEAETAFHRAIELQPDFALAHHNLGLLLHAQKRPAEAEKAHRKAIALRPDYAEAYHNLGIALYDQKRPAEAEKACRRAIQLRPDYAKAHINLGNALRALNRHTEAETTYRRALRLQPENADAHNNLGITLFYQKKLGEAEQAYRRALELRPDFPEAHTNLGIALFSLKRPAESVKAFRRATELRPNNALGHLNLGVALRGLKRPAEAEKAFRRAIHLRPDYAGAYLGLGIALREQNRPVEAEQACRRAIQLQANLVEAHDGLGRALLLLKRPQEAEAAFRKAIALRPNYAEGHARLGDALLEQKRPAEATKAFLRACRLDPNCAPGDHKLGLALREQKQLEESARAFRRADQALPRHPVIRNDLLQTERLLALDRKLTACLQGKAHPASTQEALELGAFCGSYRERPRTALRFCLDTFQEAPRLADDLQRQHRIQVARFAALAAAGKGADAAPLPAESRAGLRLLAFAWLRADLSAYRGLLENEPKAGPFVRQRLALFLSDADLASVRDPAALATLPAAERNAWNKLWADARALHKRAEAGR